MSVVVRHSYSGTVPTRAIHRAVNSVLRTEGISRAEVSVLLTDDATIRELNLRYRSRDVPTDVLSFAQFDFADGPALQATPGAPDSLLGDVVISVDAAIRQATDQRVSTSHELAHLAAHAVLHLLGYDDETDEGADLMRSREEAALSAVRGRA